MVFTEATDTPLHPMAKTIRQTNQACLQSCENIINSSIEKNNELAYSIIRIVANHWVKIWNMDTKSMDNYSPLHL